MLLTLDLIKKLDHITLRLLIPIQNIYVINFISSALVSPTIGGSSFEWIFF